MKKKYEQYKWFSSRLAAEVFTHEVRGAKIRVSRWYSHTSGWQEQYAVIWRGYEKL